MTILTDADRVLLKHVPPQYERVWTARLKWREQMHAHQVQPRGDWKGWMLRSGRGAGKTQTGAFDVAEHCLDYPNYRYGVVGPTLKDVRDTCFEGESGVIAVLTTGNDKVQGMSLTQGEDFTYNRSLADLHVAFPNGSIVPGYSSEKPDRLRGPQHHRLWFEELAAFKDAHLGNALQTTYNNAMFGLRLGADARWIATTTPRRSKLIVELDEDDRVRVSTGSTYDNIDNLADNFLDEVLRYEGSHIGRQEIHGEIVTEVEGAHWTIAMIEQAQKWKPQPGEWGRQVTGVDPSGGADVIGIVTVAEIPNCPCPYARQYMPHYVVIEDRSIKAAPEVWASKAVAAESDLIVAEANYGGAMVESTIRQVDVNAPTKLVTASRGKLIRAEPIAAIYQQNRVHHMDTFPQMEDEMTTYVAGEAWSPNRMDGLVWGITELADVPQRDYWAR